MNQLAIEYLNENKSLWLARNRPGGYNRSIASLVSLQRQVDKRIVLPEKSAFARGVNRILEKIVASGVAFFL